MIRAAAEPDGPGAATAGIAVVVPCYRVGDRVLDVLARMPACVSRVYCVDDGCPEGTGARIAERCSDPRVRVLGHDRNRGVGAAMVTGYRAALEDGARIVVKIDGDGQMDPALVPRFVHSLEEGEADYCKGNRFYSRGTVAGMPDHRLAGNALLSFLTKLSSGYWQVFDPNNGFTAIHATALRVIPLDALDEGYFFEADMLFRLNVARAVVRDIPMNAVYGGEPSSLRVGRQVGPFVRKHLRNFVKRVAYTYYLRDFNLASLELPIGLAALLFGVGFGLTAWVGAVVRDEFASAGTVMLAALPVIVGVQMLLSACNFDIQNAPRTPLQRLLGEDERERPS